MDDELTPQVLHSLLLEAELPTMLVAAIERDSPTTEVVLGIYKFAMSMRHYNKQLGEAVFSAKKRADDAVSRCANLEQTVKKQRDETERIALNDRPSENLKAEMGRQKKYIEQLRQQLADSSKKLNEERNANVAVTKRLEQAKIRIKKLKARSSATVDTESLAILQTDVEALREENDSLVSQLQKTAVELSSKSSELAASMEKVQSLQVELSKRTPVELPRNLLMPSDNHSNQKPRELASAEALKVISSELRTELSLSRKVSEQLQHSLNAKHEELIAEQNRRAQIESSLSSSTEILTKYENLKKAFHALKQSTDAELERRDLAIKNLGKQLGEFRRKDKNVADKSVGCCLSEFEPPAPPPPPQLPPPPYLEAMRKLSTAYENLDADLKRKSDEIRKKTVEVEKVERELKIAQEKVAQLEKDSKAHAKTLEDRTFLLSEEIDQLKKERKLSEKIWLSRLAVQNLRIKAPPRRLKVLEKSCKKLRSDKLTLKRQLFVLRRRMVGGVGQAVLSQSINKRKDRLIAWLKETISRKTTHINELETQLAKHDRIFANKLKQ